MRSVKITYDQETGGRVVDAVTGRILPVMGVQLNMGPQGAVAVVTLVHTIQASYEGPAVLLVADPADGQLKDVDEIRYTDRQRVSTTAELMPTPRDKPFGYKMRPPKHVADLRPGDQVMVAWTLEREVGLGEVVHVGIIYVRCRVCHRGWWHELNFLRRTGEETMTSRTGDPVKLVDLDEYWSLRSSPNWSFVSSGVPEIDADHHQE